MSKPATLAGPPPPTSGTDWRLFIGDGANLWSGEASGELSNSLDSGLVGVLRGELLVTDPVLISLMSASCSTTSKADTAAPSVTPFEFQVLMTKTVRLTPKKVINK